MTGRTGSIPQAVAAPRTVVFSVLAWAIIAPFFATAYGGFEQSKSGTHWFLGLGIALLVHLLLLPVFLGAGAVERRLFGHRGWRAGWVAFVVILIAVARPITTSALHALAGIPPVVTEWWQRYLLNAAALGIALLVIAAVASAIRRRVAVAARLDAVLADTTEYADAAAASTARLVAEFAHVVADPVRRALTDARIRPFDAATQALSLRRLAHDVIRPLSHHVFVAELTESIPVAPGPRRARRFGIAPRVLPALPWAPVVVYAVVMYPLLLIGYGPLESLARLALAAAVSLLGCWLLDFVRLQRRGVQIAVLMAGYLAIGLLVAAVSLDSTVLPLTAPDPTIAPMSLLSARWYIPLGFLLVSMLLVIARSEMAAARDIEARLAPLLIDTQRQAAAARLEHFTIRERLARVLHNQVQGEIVAMALRLQLGTADEGEVDAMERSIDAQLSAAVLPDSVLDASVSAETMARNAQLAISVWSRTMRVDSSGTPEAWEWLAHHPAAAGILLDAAVEGLTNAVRHDDARAARIEFERVAAGVRLTLRSPGRIRGATVDGFGLTDLRRRGAIVALEQDGREVVLSVEVLEVLEVA